MLDPDISKRLPQQPVASALGTEPTEVEVATAIRAMTNSQAVGSDGLPVNCSNSDFNRIGPCCWSSTDSPSSSGVTDRSNSSEKTWSLPYSTRRATRRSAETTAASRSRPTRVRCHLKWLPGDLAITVRTRDCNQRSPAGFDRIARPRT